MAEQPKTRRFQRRVLLITEHYPPAVGGIQNYLVGLFGNLDPKSVMVIAKDEGSKSREWDSKQLYKIVRVDTDRGKYPAWDEALSALKRAVGEFKPEVIVCGKALFEGRAARRILKAYGIPYVVVTYGMEVNKWLDNWKTRWDLKRVLKDAARVIVINNKTKQQLTDLGIPDGKIVKLYPAVDSFFLEKDQQAANDLRKELSLTEENKVVAAVGRLVERKGIDVLIKSFAEVKKQIPEARLLIAGEGEYRVELEKLIKKENLSDYVKLLGKVSKQRLRAVFQVSDIFALVPKEGKDMEGFGIVYLEAAVSGVCSVGSSTGGVSEAVLDGETGLLVSPDDKEATASAIVKLLRNEALRTGLAENARRRAAEQFTWPRRTALFRGIIEAAAKKKS